MNFFRTLTLFSLAILVSNCTNDSTNDLIDSTPISGNVTYLQNVKPIIDNKCLQCHGSVPTNGAPMSLVTYENVKDAVLNLGLIDRIIRNEGDDLLMPQGGPKLLQNQIEAINLWQSQGLQQ